MVESSGAALECVDQRSTTGGWVGWAAVGSGMLQLSAAVCGLAGWFWLADWRIVIRLFRGIALCHCPLARPNLVVPLVVWGHSLCGCIDIACAVLNALLVSPSSSKPHDAASMQQRSLSSSLTRRWKRSVVRAPRYRWCCPLGEACEMRRAVVGCACGMSDDPPESVRKIVRVRACAFCPTMKRNILAKRHLQRL